jgi:hypothetical protein
MLSNILLSRLTPYADEIIGDHQCGFRHNRSTTDQMFYIWQILDKKCEYNGTLHILIEFGILRKLAGLINMCLNETYSTVCIGNNLSDKFPIQNGLKQGDALTPMLFNFALNTPLGGPKTTRKV